MSVRRQKKHIGRDVKTINSREPKRKLTVAIDTNLSLRHPSGLKEKMFWNPTRIIIIGTSQYTNIYFDSFAKPATYNYFASLTIITV